MMRDSITQPLRLWQPLAVLALLWLWAMPAQAAVQEIRVLATGVDRSSTKAAEMALDYAKKRAVYLVARKMQVEEASAKLQKLKPEQWRDIVRGATVLQTRREGEITYADVSVTVVNEALRRALGVEEPVASQVDAMGAGRGVLLLPVMVGADRPYLWENENLLTTPLRSEALHQARGAVMVAAGDFDDRRLVDYQNALEVTAEQLKPMFKRYGVDEIVIAVATLGAAGTREPVEVILRRLAQPPAEMRVEKLSLDATEKDTVELRVARAAGAVAGAAAQIATSTSQSEQARLKEAPSLPIIFRYATAQHLGSMQEAVRKAPGVLQLVMPAIALKQMQGVLYLSGEREAVRKHLVQQGFIITDEGDGWIISLR